MNQKIKIIAPPKKCISEHRWVFITPSKNVFQNMSGFLLLPQKMHFKTWAGFFKIAPSKKYISEHVWIFFKIAPSKCIFKTYMLKKYA